MTDAVVAQMHWHTMQATPQTRWSFVELRDAQGRVGVGEATLAQQELAMLRAFEALRPAVLARMPVQVDVASARSNATTRAEFAVISALDQAVLRLAAQQRGVCVSEALGGRRRERIRTYANINRSVGVRTPRAFADQARRAADEGFTAVKIAPLDGVELAGDARRNVDAALLDAALARVAAVRAAIGPDVELMVDCHWRLNRRVAESLIDALEPYRLHWLECPLPECAELLDDLCALRARTNAVGVRLAGCETMSRVEGFLPFLRAGAYDVMMPDVKHVGGMREMLRVARTLQRHDVAFSPHNPSGPVCHAASLQICAAAARVERLEIQYRETPLFDALVDSALPGIVAGESAIPRAAGLGVRLDAALLATHRVALEEDGSASRAHPATGAS